MSGWVTILFFLHRNSFAFHTVSLKWIPLTCYLPAFFVFIFLGFVLVYEAYYCLKGIHFIIPHFKNRFKRQKKKKKRALQGYLGLICISSSKWISLWMQQMKTAWLLRQTERWLPGQYERDRSAHPSLPQFRVTTTPWVMLTFTREGSSSLKTDLSTKCPSQTHLLSSSLSSGENSWGACSQGSFHCHPIKPSVKQTVSWEVSSKTLKLHTFVLPSR